MKLPRSEHPRPDFQRENWLCLNGEWEFSFETDSFDKRIIVPYACETELSGIGDKGFHSTVWYRKSFRLPDTMAGKCIMLHFGAVDYSCDLWVNGNYICSHTGGQTGFHADITGSLLVNEENVIVLKAFDDYADMEMPRGKQYWKKDSESIFYSRMTGIWQSVWLEAVDRLHLTGLRITPMLDDRAVRFAYFLSVPAAAVEFQVTFENVEVARVLAEPDVQQGSVLVRLDETVLRNRDVQSYTWSPEQPRLFGVTVRVFGEAGQTDRVETYFGLRKVSIENGIFLLNNRPYYQKLVLDQGYWESSLMTAPTDADFIRDIQLTKAMGFNGVRKHQKVEDPRFLYHADRLGLLVWGEIGAARQYSEKYARRMYSEWMEAVERDYNHPCIVAWVPLNESWGVQNIRTDAAQQAHCNALVSMTKSVDSTRVVIDNDGWEHTAGDLLTVHDYSDSGSVLMERYREIALLLDEAPEGRPLFSNGWSYRGQPVMVTEFGGIRYVPISNAKQAWGYCDTEDITSYAHKLAELIGALHASPLVQGYCYTQLTDIEAEENGLLTYDRTYKLPIETICAINEGRWDGKIK